MTSQPPAPPPGWWPQQHPPGDWSAPGWAPPRRNGAAALSLILGLVALPATLFVVPGFLFGIVALALGLIGRGRVKRGESDAAGRATAGTVLGAVAIMFTMAWGALVYSAAERNQEDYEACLRSGNDRQQCIDEFEPRDP